MSESVLDKLLVALDVSVEAFAVLEVRAGCKLVFDQTDAVIVHYVLDGEMVLETPSAKPLHCGPRKIAILPAALPQAVAAGSAPAVDVLAAENCAMVRGGLLLFDAGAGKPDLRVACGMIMASLGGSFGVLDRIEAPIVIDIAATGLLEHSFAVIETEVAQPRLGTRAMVSALMKVCLLTALRGLFDDEHPGAALLGGLQDPRLGRAVVAVLDRPGADHTVDGLAEIAGMSRSTFAREFRRSLAMSPIEFVGKARLHHGAELLRSTTLPIKVIAASIGFASRSHFSRAFRRAYHTDPTRFRRNATRPELDAPANLRGSRSDFALPEEPED